jgi:hypothetical protein
LSYSTNFLQKTYRKGTSNNEINQRFNEDAKKYFNEKSGKDSNFYENLKNVKQEKDHFADSSTNHKQENEKFKDNNNENINNKNKNDVFFPNPINLEKNDGKI